MTLEPRTRPQQFLDALAVLAGFMGAMLGLGSTSAAAPPAMAWVAGGMLAAAVVAKAAAALLRVSWTVDGDCLVLKGRFGVVRSVPFQEVTAVGVSATKVAVGSGGAYVVHGPVLVRRDGRVFALAVPASGAAGYEKAVAAVQDLAARGLPLHPPEQALTLEGRGGRAEYVPLRQDLQGFVVAAVALALVFGVLVLADQVLGLSPLPGR